MEKSFWIICIVFTVANGYNFKYKSQKYIQQNPELKEGYDKIFRGWMLYFNIPWVIMGIGLMTGMVDHMHDFFRIKEFKPIVIFFHTVMIGLWILGSRWIYFKGGAEMLSSHPGLIDNTLFGSDKNISPFWVKVTWTLILCGSILSLYFMLIK